MKKDNLNNEQRFRLKEVRNGLKLSQAEFSKAVGYSLSSISAIEAGNQKIPVTFAYFLQDRIVKDAYGVCRIIQPNEKFRPGDARLRGEWLLLGIGEAYSIERQNPIQNGFTIKLHESQDSFDLPIENSIIFTKILDDTMSPLLFKNDIAAVDKDKKDINSGRIYLIKLFGEKLFRQVYKVDETNVMIKSMREDLIPRTTIETDKIEIIGQQIYSIRFNT